MQPLPRCKDCHLEMTEQMLAHHLEPNVPEHQDRCCDCTDELFGMPAKKRHRPRPALKHE